MSSLNYTAEDVIGRAQALVEWNYVYGAKYKDAPLTKARLNELRAQNSQIYTDNYYKQAKALIGTNCIDCSGLVCHALGISDIGSWALHDKPDNDSNYTYGSLDNPEPGSILWRSGHCAIYTGDKSLVEAKGINYGVIESGYYKAHWKAVIIPPFKKMDYENLGWNWDGTGWWYVYGHTKGEYYKNCVAYIDGQYYAFDSNGYNVLNPSLTTDDRGRITTLSGHSGYVPH